jgi:ArsR family transcriptional regulator
MAAVLEILKVLADEARLRILRALLQAELSVAELVQALNLPQSTVSRHLKPLKQVGLLSSRRDGTSIYYGRGKLFQDQDFHALLHERIKEVSFAHEDSMRVEHVLEIRRKKNADFFDELAGKYQSLAAPGGGWDALAAGMAAGFSGKYVADLGCGEGELSIMAGRFAAHVTCIDQSQKMLDFVKERAQGMAIEHRFDFIQLDLNELTLSQETYDAVFISQSLHHVTHPEAVVKQAAASLKNNGVLIILDLLRHEHEWTREQWADHWLGFEPNVISEWMNEAGLNVLSTEGLSGSVADLSVIMVVAKKEG